MFGIFQTEKDVKQSEECVICMDAKPDMLVVPCKHKIVCYNCVKQTVKLNNMKAEVKCPICRGLVQGFLNDDVHESSYLTPSEVKTRLIGVISEIAKEKKQLSGVDSEQRKLLEKSIEKKSEQSNNYATALVQTFSKYYTALKKEYTAFDIVNENIIDVREFFTSLFTKNFDMTVEDVLTLYEALRVMSLAMHNKDMFAIHLLVKKQSQQIVLSTLEEDRFVNELD